MAELHTGLATEVSGAILEINQKRHSKTPWHKSGHACLDSLKKFTQIFNEEIDTDATQLFV
jgi:hypothetical protein